MPCTALPLVDCEQSSRTSEPRDNASGRARGGQTGSPSIAHRELGGTSYAGTLDGLTTWQGQISYDDSTQTVYAIGNVGSLDTSYVFSQKLGTDKTKRVFLSSYDGGVTDYTVGGLSKNAQLVTAYWDGGRERIALVDPLTGSTQVVGSVGDLTTWSTQLVYGGASGTLVAYGRGPNGAAHLYAVPLGK